MNLHYTQLFPEGWQNGFDPHFRRISAGLDVATTVNKKSNPSSLTLNQLCNDINFFRLKLKFKTDDPEVTFKIIKYANEHLPHGFKIGKICIDATSERFFAVSLKRRLQSIGISCELVDSGAAIEYMGERMNYKAFLGNMLSNAYADGKIATAAQEWIKDDTRQVYRTKGTFAADVDEKGNHADGFDADKLAYYAINSLSASAHAEPVSVGMLSRMVNRIVKNPLLKNRNNRNTLHT